MSLGAQHGYGVLLRIEQITGGALAIEQGALYPALYRLEHQGLLDTEWGTPKQPQGQVLQPERRGAKAAEGRTERWNGTALAMNTALRAQEA